MGGRDLLRPENGTWLGITRQGRIAVLTNFRETDEQGMPPIVGARSRGAIPNAWLKRSPDSEDTVEDFMESLIKGDALENVGGFSLLCGRLQKARNGGIMPLAILSNRSLEATTARWILESRDEVQGLSNSAFHDPWPKVQLGNTLLTKAVQESASAHESTDDLVRRLFELLSLNTLPARRPNQTFETYLEQLRHSIMIPPLRAHVSSMLAHNIAPVGVNQSIGEAEAISSEPNNEVSPLYGTQKQTVILVDPKGHLTFIERTLFDENSEPVPVDEQERRFSFDILGWES